MTNETVNQNPNQSTGQNANEPAGPLDTARLGTTDLTITRVGFGSWAVSGSG
jgi:hypothetical protein